jgi:hypothetical protein
MKHNKVEGDGGVVEMCCLILKKKSISFLKQIEKGLFIKSFN